MALELEQKRRQLRAVGEISAALASALELETTLDVITRVMSEVMGVASCSIYLQDQDRLLLKATTGLAQEAIGQVSLARGEGLTGWTVTHGEPVASRDARKDPRFKLLPQADEQRLHSLLAVPLMVQGRTIGAMNVQTVEPHDFSTDEIELLSLSANLAAGALEKAALYDRMRHQIEELEGLQQVSRTVTSPLYLDEMLGVVSEMAAQVMGVKAVVLHLVDVDTGRLVLRAAHNTSLKERATTSVAIGEGLVGLVAQLGEPLALGDVRADGRHRNPEIVASEGLVSFLGVPLIVRDHTVGVLSCYTGEAYQFTKADIDLLSMLGNQTALAIENARLVMGSAVVQEMHHRVKNNLQTVAMLLRLQMGSAKDNSTRDILAAAMTRILSIAAVHETLSEKGLHLVDVKQVLERIVRHVADLAGEIDIRVEGESLSLPSRAATSLALVASELVQNSIKHAFVGRDRGEIRVILSRVEEDHLLEVCDDGVGSNARRSERKGLGMEIVETLVHNDLEGEFTTTASANGTCVRVLFPDSLIHGGSE